MIRNALSFVFLAGFLAAQSVAETPFENFVVAVWPEYDHPGVLVICTGTVKSDRLPLTLEVRVPDETTVVMAVGQSDTVSDLSPVDLVQRAGGQWVDLTVVRNSFQLEYYFNPFTASENRQVKITLQLNQPLADYHIAIQHPLAAQGFTFSEKEIETFSDEHGLTYSRTHLPSLAAGSAKEISFSYRNPSGRLSVALLQEMLGGDLSSPSATSGGREKISRFRLPTYEPLTVLGLLAVAVGFLFWRSNSKSTPPSTGDAQKKFCHQCGTKVKESDRFCSGCGSKLP